MSSNNKSKKQSKDSSKIIINNAQDNITNEESNNKNNSNSKKDNSPENKNENISNEQNQNISNKNGKTNKKSKKSKKSKNSSEENKDQNNDNINIENKENNEQPKKEEIPEVIETKIINELPKNDVLENKVKNVIYKICFSFNNQDNYITVKPQIKMVTIINKIINKLNKPIDQLSFYYNEKEITEKYNDMTVKEFFNFPKNKSRPIIYVNNKQNNNNNFNTINVSSEIDKFGVIYKKGYENKVKIMNYPSFEDINVGVNEDIYNVINTFLKETNINSDFICERKDENLNKKIEIKSNDNLNNNIDEDNKINNNNKNIVYIIGFPSPDIAFDFNRYMNSLKIMNPTFKNIKLQILLSKKKVKKNNKQINDAQNEDNNINYKRNYNYRYGALLNMDEMDLDKRNIEVLNVIRNNFLNNKLNGITNTNNSSNYLNSSSPYVTPYEERIKEKHENRKKWLNPKGFISSVNKYSGIHI